MRFFKKIKNKNIFLWFILRKNSSWYFIKTYSENIQWKGEKDKYLEIENTLKEFKFRVRSFRLVKLIYSEIINKKKQFFNRLTYSYFYSIIKWMHQNQDKNSPYTPWYSFSFLQYVLKVIKIVDLLSIALTQVARYDPYIAVYG